MLVIIADAIALESAALEQLVTPAAVRGWGSDLKCVDDIDARGTELDPDSYAVLGQDAYHAVTTARGSLPDDPDFGIDLRSLIHKATSTAEVMALEGAIRAELLKDDRIADATAAITASGETYNIDIRITPTDPQLNAFSMLMTIQDGAAMLQAFDSAR